MDHYKTYQPLMDQATVLWSTNLTHYAWKADYHLGTTEFMVLEWFNLVGERFYSIIYAVAGQMNCIEIVGKELAPKYEELAVRYNGTRYTHHVFTTAAINTTAYHFHDYTYLEPLSISKATTDVAAVEKFYENIMLAKTERYTYDGGQNNGNVTVLLVTLAGADLVLKFVQRGTAFTLDDAELTVLEMQHAKNAAHNASYKSMTCGMDRFYDNHYAYNVPTGQYFNATIGEISERLFFAGVKFTCISSALWIQEPVTGDVIEYSFSHMKHFASMEHSVPNGTKFREEMEYCIHNMTLDIADLCSDGNCEEFVSEEPVDQCKNLA
uniref:Uncharacterized protein n=1 Tax=Florenciella parvula TaxID=236787 RepID=A0A7S2B8P2_9STRA|mmetsp:Transcript_14391/g.30189  ORF Transcript_14391/g.30189 Transcript_14391/m.30189 type:complete len:324 (+) Transcript_14391:1-972(+)